MRVDGRIRASKPPRDVELTSNLTSGETKKAGRFCSWRSVMEYNAIALSICDGNARDVGAASVHSNACNRLAGEDFC